MATQARYDKYRPEDMPVEAWCDLLGADVNNLTHMPLTYGLARAFINHARTSAPDMLSHEEEELLLIAALTHDWGESITSDISYGDKTRQDELDGQAAFEASLAEFYQGEYFEQVDQARRVVIFDPTTKLGRVFNAIEKVGYVRTALRADYILENSTEIDPQLENGLQWLVYDALSNLHAKSSLSVVPKLLEYREFPPVAKYLDDVKDDVEAAFDRVIKVENAILNNYGSRAVEKQLQMMNTYHSWLMYWEEAAA